MVLAVYLVENSLSRLCVYIADAHAFPNIWMTNVLEELVLLSLDERHGAFLDVYPCGLLGLQLTNEYNS